MKQDVVLRIHGKQTYVDQEPEIIELVTEGTLERVSSGWKIVYAESELTGMQGVTTSFLVENHKITLDRTGALHSQMVFQEGIAHDSLYQIPYGALMITVNPVLVRSDITEAGGTIDLVYGIEIEQSASGAITYHLDITAK